MVLGLQKARSYFSQLGRSKAVRKKYDFSLSASHMGGHPFSAYTCLVITVHLGVKWSHIPLRKKESFKKNGDGIHFL
jgi:hypothetical protein